MDILRLNDIQVFAHHGNKPEEKNRGQIFLINAEIRCDLRRAGLTDDLKDTIDFDMIYEIVSETVKNTQFNLLEALGEEICQRLLKVYPDTEVVISIRKPDPPISGKVGSVEVVLCRNSRDISVNESEM